MSIKNTLALASLVVSASAFAQATLGTVSNVQGVVTVSDGVTGGMLTNGSPITDGMRFVSTSSGTVTLQLNSGCSVTLRPNQAVTVLKSMTCQDLVAAVQPVTPPPANLAHTIGGVHEGFVFVGAGVGAGVMYDKIISKW